MDYVLACPICKKRLDTLFCKSCNIDFSARNVASFICREMYHSQAEYADAMRIIDFWGNGWKKRLTEPDHAFIFGLDAAQLANYADQSLDWHRRNKTLMGVEVPIDRIEGKTVLNIGCGAGDEALILTRAGAHCIAMDITAPAAETAESLIRKLGRGIGIQGDARFIPLEESSVDFVYSSGVLHHSPNIAKSVSEILRVLKPGGTAYIMLYATWSITFMQEKLMKWTGEQAWETEGRKNPCTTTYSQRQCREMFSAFNEVTVRQNGASLKQFAKIGRYMPTVLDRYIDAPLGANLNIAAKKA